jgi:hypothetical protein
MADSTTYLRLGFVELDGERLLVVPRTIQVDQRPLGIDLDPVYL